MPIKIPKAISRRRSSGNVLEELPNPPEPSFRVLERPSSRSFDGGQALKRLSHGRPLSADQLAGHYTRNSGGSRDITNNRTSGATNNSRSSGGHDNSSSSARYSSSSTIPSSTDAPVDERPPPPIAKDSYNMPAPPIPESTGLSLKAASRAFSFGRKKTDLPPLPTSRPSVGHSQSDGFTQQNIRGRAATDTSFTSGSTATPPRILDAGLDFGRSDQDGFGAMFENFGRSTSQLDLTQKGLGLHDVDSQEGTQTTTTPERLGLTPAPLHIDRSREVDPAPATWTSHHSQDGFIASSSPMERTFSYEEDVPLSTPGRGILKSQTMPLPNAAGLSNRATQQRPPSEGLRKGSQPGNKKVDGATSGRLQDEDARLVMDSLNASRRLEKYSNATYSDDDDNPLAALVSRRTPSASPYMAQGPSRMPQNGQKSPQPLYEGRVQNYTSSRWGQGSANTTSYAPKATNAVQEEASLFDAPDAFSNKTPLPARPKLQPPAKPQTQNKIMTPAEFERYRREQEIKSTADLRTKQDSSDDEAEDDDDEDEVERSRQAARQRRKQEANMSVYRQQMMKVTGEQPSDLPSLQFRPSTERASASTPNLRSTPSIPEINFDKPVEGGKASDEEDEDVPLGVLAAHGFPSKNRPPSATGNPAPNVQFKSESYPPPPSSVSGASQAGRASGLPPFARNLPADPYYGAGLVNPSNREPLAMGHRGSSPAPPGTQPAMPPGGLVGVINAEERARAARRGSPNAPHNFGAPLPPSMMPPMGMTPGMPPAMSAGEQATVQMTEQMSKMMQVQMQWMQQMQAMMAGGMMPPGQQPPFMPQPPMMMMNSPGMPQPHGPMQRPISQGSYSAPGAPPGLRPSQTRAMSMTGLMPTSNWHPQGPNRQSAAPSLMSGGLGGPGPGYAPSIAPSERSNVGMPSRYRPVSIAPTDERQVRMDAPRTSTFTEGTLRPGVMGQNGRLSTSGDRSQSRLSSLRPVSTTPPKKAASDSDEEEGWEEMKKKRDKKKSTWRLHRKKEEPQPQFDVYDYPEES